MPSQMGGFDAGAVLSDFMQMQGYAQRMKAHKRSEEEYQRKRQSALVEALSDTESLSGHMGPEFAQGEDTLSAIEKRHGLDPEQAKQYRARVSGPGGLQSKALQLKKQELRQELMHYQSKEAERKVRQKKLFDMARRSGDPEMQKMAEEDFSAQTQEQRQANKLSIMRGYAPIMKDPEVQQWMQQFDTDSIMGGPGAPVTEEQMQPQRGMQVPTRRFGPQEIPFSGMSPRGSGFSR